MRVVAGRVGARKDEQRPRHRARRPLEQAVDDGARAHTQAHHWRAVRAAAGRRRAVFRRQRAPLGLATLAAATAVAEAKQREQARADAARSATPSASATASASARPLLAQVERQAGAIVKQRVKHSACAAAQPRDRAYRVGLQCPLRVRAHLGRPARRGRRERAKPRDEADDTEREVEAAERGRGGRRALGALAPLPLAATAVAVTAAGLAGPVGPAGFAVRLGEGLVHLLQQRELLVRERAPRAARLGLSRLRDSFRLRLRAARPRLGLVSARARVRPGALVGAHDHALLFEAREGRRVGGGRWLVGGARSPISRVIRRVAGWRGRRLGARAAARGERGEKVRLPLRVVPHRSFERRLARRAGAEVCAVRQ